MSSQLSPEIRLQLQRLTEKQAFLQSLDDYVKVAVDTLCGTGEEYTQQACPTALLLAFSHCFCNNIPLSYLASQFPEASRQQFLKSCSNYGRRLPQNFIEQGLQQLSDVQWSIDINLGRQLWNISLKFTSGKILKLTLNYEQLSVLVFKIGQAVTFAQNFEI